MRILSGLSHWFVLWPTHIPCKFDNKEHETPVIDKYGVKLFVHKVHSIKHTCSSGFEDKAVLNAMVYLGLINDDSILLSSVTKNPSQLNVNIISCLDNYEDDNKKNSTIYVEPIAVLENIANNIPKAAPEIDMMLKRAQHPPYVILVSS